ncbi:MAG: hypothetical protein HY901_22660 [Deltaproteobacteria bacterium]|nr:hypothetical protein [Deltaproteobacteria bacterium]
MTVLLFVLWALGVVSGAALGAWVHLLAAFGLVALVLAAAQAAGRRGRGRAARP